MKSSFDREGIVPGLPAIILLSHGELALGMLDTVRLIMDKTDNIAAFVLEMGDDPEAYREAFLEAIYAFPGEVLIFVDMMSGSPCNQLLLASGRIGKQFHAFAGMNLPLISEAVFMRQICEGEALANAIMEAGSSSIVDLGKVIKDLEKEG